MSVLIFIALLIFMVGEASRAYTDRFVTLRNSRIYEENLQHLKGTIERMEKEKDRLQSRMDFMDRSLEFYRQPLEKNAFVLSTSGMHALPADWYVRLYGTQVAMENNKSAPVMPEQPCSDPRNEK